MISEKKRIKNLQIKTTIFQAAMDLMNDIGFESLTIRDICDKAQISTGMFYRQFKSKDALLAFYFDQAQNEFQLEYLPQHHSHDVKTEILQFYTWYAQYTSDFGIEFCINFFNTKNEAMNTDQIYNRILQYTTDCIDQAAQNGYQLPENESSDSLSKEICILYKGCIFDWCAHKGSYSLKERVQKLMGCFIPAILFPTN